MSTLTPTPTSLPLRILLLHGYTQTPTTFHAKTRALHKHLLRLFPPPHYALSFHYAPAPHKLPPSAFPNLTAPNDDGEYEEPEGYGWWRRRDKPRDDGKGGWEVVYEGIEEGLDRIAAFVREEGPFVGVVGFSQGAAAAGMVASLLEGEGRREAFVRAERKGGMPYPDGFLAREGDKGAKDGFVQAPMKFAVCYSGFRAPGPLYDAFYEPRIKTPVLHVLGQVDVVVEEKRARDLMACCEGGEERMVMHPGGHFVPSAKMWLDAVGGFVKQCVEGKVKGRGEREKDEVSVEDMVVPF